MILAADENDLGLRTYFALKVLGERHTAESASHDNHPSFTHCSTSGLHSFHGLTIPSFFMRNWSVERFIPSRSAAPLGPAITHFVFFSVSRISARSVSAMVWNSNVAGFGTVRLCR